MPILRWGCLMGPVLAAACGVSKSSGSVTRAAAVIVSASTDTIRGVDSVTFVARIRPDIAAELSNAPSDTLVPHIVGWVWIPDLDGIDPWTRGCASTALSCATEVHGSGTMVFSIRLLNEICAGWAHVESLSVPDIDLESDDPRRRLRDDSISMAMKTKSASWQPCGA